MTPTLVASRTALPPEGAHFALGRPGGETLAPTLFALCNAHGRSGAGIGFEPQRHHRRDIGPHRLAEFVFGLAHGASEGLQPQQP